MVMQDRKGYTGSDGNWYGTGGIVAHLSVPERLTLNPPSEYKASEYVELLPGFESLSSTDEFSVYLVDQASSSGNNTAGANNANSGNYRYGFNGKEYDDETETQDYGMRIYNPALAKFLSVDPLDRKS